MNLNRIKKTNKNDNLVLISRMRDLLNLFI